MAISSDTLPLSLINFNIFNISGGAISWDFQTLIGFVFAFLVGVPWQDAVQAGSVMATKLLSNEFSNASTW